MATVTSILKGNCPICEKGKIFESKGNLFLLKAPKMNECCSECGYRFEKEPGYFLGAMYVSYAMTIAELFPVFLALVWFVSFNWMFAIMLATLVLTMFFNFRMSRIFWIHIFHQ